MSKEITLITVDDIKERTNISMHIDADLLEPSILVGEEFHVYDILGTALTTELKEQLSMTGVTGVTTGSTGTTVVTGLTELNEILLTKYIAPLSAYAAWFEAAPFLGYKTTAKGIVKQNSSNSDSVSESEFAFYRKAIKDKVSLFQTRLDKYLNENKDKYPLFRPCRENSSDSYSNGIYLAD